MDILLSQSVIHGHLSNEVPYRITGQIHLRGLDTPITVEIEGNFLRDIAGCRIDFCNPYPPRPGAMPPLPDLAGCHRGVAGEISASRRVRTLVEKDALPRKSGIQPVDDTLKNMLLIEWFGPGSQRVLIRACRWNLRVTEPRWSLTEAQEWAQIQRIRAMRREFLVTQD